MHRLVKLFKIQLKNVLGDVFYKSEAWSTLWRTWYSHKGKVQTQFKIKSPDLEQNWANSIRSPMENKTITKNKQINMHPCLTFSKTLKNFAFFSYGQNLWLRALIYGGFDSVKQPSFLVAKYLSCKLIYLEKKIWLIKDSSLSCHRQVFLYLRYQILHNSVFFSTFSWGESSVYVVLLTQGENTRGGSLWMIFRRSTCHSRDF